MRAFLPLLCLLVPLAVTPPALACTGDCDADGAVSVDELVTMVNVALERYDVSRCAAGDRDGDNAIAIDEIVTAVDHALGGCPVGSAPGLYAAIGIGANWGAHWSASPSAIDPRDNQDDAAFPPEICLVANAGFQSIRLYGEPVATWLAVVEGVRAYNQGALLCRPGQMGPPARPLAVVYEAAICAPDPASLPWNGAVAAQNIGSVACKGAPGTFQQSVQAEIVKLRQVLQYAGDAFADTVKLVFVGNEILFSRGACGNGGAVCTSNADCGGGACAIGHYCSGTLAGSEAQAKACTQQSDCGAVDGPDGLCTDVTNGQALAWAFDQVRQALVAALGAGNVPPITISLQVDVMTGITPGLPPATAPLLWSRQQLAAALPAKVVAVNAYPDQWGLVPAGGAVPPYPSCIDASNAVNGSALDAARCPGGAAAYADAVTGTLAHTIDTSVQLLGRYYPDYEIVLAETGWHTDGACSDYNDAQVAPARYSPAAAATYLQALYQYVAGKRIPLLVFEMFDQKTKTCTVSGGAVPAEANYGVFGNYCQLKNDLPALLPPGADLAAFNLLLSPDGSGGPSCRNQALLTVQGVGNTGVCARKTGVACLGDCGADGPCVWGHCAENPAQGCNPNDPSNPAPCTCTRAGNCYGTASPAGFYLPTSLTAPPCSAASDCSSASCPFAPCGCFVAMAPATLPAGNQAEGPGALVQYGNGSLTFSKSVGPLPVVQPSNGALIVQPLWENVVVGTGWTVSLQPPAGGTAAGTPSPCTNSVQSVSPGPGASITWQSPWSCSYPGGQSLGVGAAALTMPRTFLQQIPTWPPPQ